MRNQNKRVGAFVGKFYPPHAGHLWVIDESAKILDKVYVIISCNKLRNNQIYKDSGFNELDAEIIKGWFKEHYKNNPKIVVEIFDESGLKPYPDDRGVWADKFKKQFPEVNVKIADEGYRQYNSEYFPEYEFMAINREKIPVHSTNLRGNINEYWDYLIPEARAYFKNKN